MTLKLKAIDEHYVLFILSIPANETAKLRFDGSNESSCPLLVSVIYSIVLILGTIYQMQEVKTVSLAVLPC